LGVIAAISVPLLIFIGGPSSDAAGYHEGRMFALTETSGLIFLISLAMIGAGSTIYLLTRQRGSRSSEVQ
jgi:hypothetical protein